jgi:hypothetical protein
VCDKLDDKTIFGSPLVINGVRFAWARYGKENHILRSVRYCFFVALFVASIVVYGSGQGGGGGGGGGYVGGGGSKTYSGYSWRATNIVLQVLVFLENSYMFWIEIVQVSI